MGGEADLPITVSDDGLTVEKRLNREHREHLAVVLDVDSDRQDKARIHISDPVPSRFPVGFHPDFGGKHWSITSNGVEFKRVLDPGERFTTVYAIGNVTEADLAELAVEPTIELQEEIDSPGAEESEPSTDVSVESGLFKELRDLDEEISIDELDPLDQGDDFEDEAIGETTQSPATSSNSGGVEGPFDSSYDQPQVLDEGDTGGGWPITVGLQNVRVEKRLDTEMFSFPAVVFELIPTTDGPIEIRLEDTIPPAVSANDISFHHRYGNEEWEQKDDTVVFEGEIGAGETYTTLYAVRDLGDTPEKAFLEAPSVSIMEEGPDGHDKIDSEFQLESRDATDPEVEQHETDFTASDPTEAGDSEGELFGLRSDATEGTADHRVDRGRSGDAASGGSTDLSPTDAGTHDAGRADVVSDNMEREEDRTVDQGRPEGRMRFDNANATNSNITGSNQEPEVGAGGLDSATESNPPAIEHGGSGGTGGPRNQGSELEPPRWIPVSFRRTISDLEEAVNRLEQSTASEKPTIEAVQSELETLKSEFDTIRGSLELVETRSSSMESTLGNLDESLSSIQANLSEHDDDWDANFSEIDVTLSDLAEEVSLIKSTLASDLETSYQLRSNLEGFETELSETGEMATVAAERTSAISEGVTSILEEILEIRSVLDTNNEALTDLQSDQTKLRESLQSVREEVSELDDRIGELETRISSYGTVYERVKHAMLGEMKIRSKRQLDELSPAERELLQQAETLPTTLVRGIGKARAKALETQLGISDIPTLANADPEAIASTAMVTVDEALRVVDTARALNDFTND